MIRPTRLKIQENGSISCRPFSIYSVHAGVLELCGYILYIFFNLSFGLDFGILWHFAPLWGRNGTFCLTFLSLEGWKVV